MLLGLINTVVIMICLVTRQANAVDEEGLIYYDVFVFKSTELIVYFTQYFMIGGFVGYVFYRSWIGVLLIGFLMMWMIIIKREEQIKKRKDLLIQQFKDAIYIISTSLSVGKSMNHAIGESASELSKIYLGDSAFMVRELEVMYAKLSMNATVESVFNHFSKRANIDDIRDFTHVLIMGRKKGANINELIRKTSQVIGDKIQIQRDITTLLTAKKFEFRIMTVMPVFFIAFITKSSPELMEPVYTELLGRFAMSAALVLFAGAYFLGEQLIKIEV
jgi:tight adherence protein B